MRAWTAVITLGAVALAAGGALVALHLHRTIGLGGIGLGAVLVIIGLGGSLLKRGGTKAEVKRTITPNGQRSGYRKAGIAVLVIVLIGVGTYYGTSYLAGVQVGTPQSGSPTTNTGQGPSQTGTGTTTLSSTLILDTSGTVSTQHVTTPSTTTVGTSSATSQTTPSITSGTTSSATSTGSISTSQQTQSTNQSTIASSSCSGSTKTLDGSAIDYNASGTSGSVRLTTAMPNDIIVVFVSATGDSTGGNTTPPAIAHITDSSGLVSFHRRAMIVTNTLNIEGYLVSEEEWYGIASAPLPNDVIQVQLSANSPLVTIIAFGVSGVDTSSPFDPGLGGPVAVAGTTQGTISAGISTTCSRDMIIGGAAMASLTPQVGTGYTLIESDNGQSPGANPIAEYQGSSAQQSNLQVSFENEGLSGLQTWIVIADALN